MKKNLKLLTGIVFLITILVAGGCSNNSKKNDSSKEDPAMMVLSHDTTTVKIYLKDREIEGVMHLEMSDSKKPDCPVIDNLETVVNPGDTVIFYKAPSSKVEVVSDIRLLKEGYTISSQDFKPDSGLYVLMINPLAPDSTIVKYQIDFKIKHDTTTYTIDPYLKIPREL